MTFSNKGSFRLPELFEKAISESNPFSLYRWLSLTMGPSKRLLLLVGTLITSHSDGFGVKSHSRITRPQRSFISEPPHALFADYDIEGAPRAGFSSINNRHSASDWLYNVMSLPKSSVLRDIRNPVVTVAAWSTAVSIVQRCLAMSSSGILKQIASNMCIGATPHNFLVSSLGLLLVFRTNSAYQRFYVSSEEGNSRFPNTVCVF